MTAHRNGQQRALVTGILGQDGWYLSRQLVGLGYEVHGTTHRQDGLTSLVATAPVVMHKLDLGDETSITRLLLDGQFDEIYNLAAVSPSGSRFRDPPRTADINGVAVARMLEVLRLYSPRTRFCQASSSEVFGGVHTSPQSESTPRIPVTPYGAAKLYADHLVSIYRTTYDVFACSAILFSHESPRRGPGHVVRKITRGVAAIEAGFDDHLTLGNLNAVRDWGHADDYMAAMRLILTQKSPRDFVIATGLAHTVGDVCEIAFGLAGLPMSPHVRLDPSLIVDEPAPRVGDPALARDLLGWVPTRTLEDIVRELLNDARHRLKSVSK